MKVFLVICVLKFFVLDFGYALNENCTTDDDCSTEEKSVCLQNSCSCDSLWEYNEDQEKCVKYATEHGSICYSDTQCTPFLGDDTTCQNNICVCADGYRWYQGKCRQYANKDEPCSENVICLDLSNPLALACINSTCQCSSDSYYDRGVDCRHASKLDEECAISNDCIPQDTGTFGELEYSHCELGKCMKGVQVSSLPVESYMAPNSDTTSNFKGGYDNFVTVEDDACPDGVSSNLTMEECVNCSNTLYFQNSSCICKQGFFLNEGRCIAELGVEDTSAQYVNDTDCPIKPGKVVDGVCYCKDYWFQDSTNRECKKTTLEYTLNCMDNDWCKVMGNYAYCNADTKKCQCIGQADFNETSFYCNLKENANLTGICLSDSHCPLYETCLNEQCQCTDGFYRTEETGLCLPTIGHSCEVRSCSHIDKAVCSTKELCVCDGDNYVTDGSSCLKVATKLNEECEINDQCTNLNFTACLTDSSKNATTRCLCTDDYLNLNGTCHAIKYPGSLCSTRLQCTNMLGDTFVCRNMICQCPIGESLNNNNICVGTTSSSQRLTLDIALIAILSLLLLLGHQIE